MGPAAEATNVTYFLADDDSAFSLKYQPKTKADPGPAKAVTTGRSKTWKIQLYPNTPAVYRSKEEYTSQRNELPKHAS